MEEQTSDTLALGREAYRHRDWSTAFSQLRAADHATLLSPEDLEKLAMSAHLTGMDTDSAEFLARAHRDYLDAGDVIPAARCAFWLALRALVIEGDPARSTGWHERGLHLVDEAGLDCVERAYLDMLTAIRFLYQGDLDQALIGFDHVGFMAERFHDPDLRTVYMLGKGQVLVRTDHVRDGMTLFDEVMAGVTAGDASPFFAGIAYCAVIEECHLMFDVRRAHAWTEALNRWSSAQPGLVPYRRQCLAYRAEILRFRGAWSEAQEEATRACELVSQVPDHLSTANALYEQAEVHRLRGDYDEAEMAYRQASALGRTPHPGLALLRLAQGRKQNAQASLQHEVAGASNSRNKALLLSAYVEVLLASNALTEARIATDALAEIAAELDARLLNAIALQARGAVLLAEGDSGSAITALRAAWRMWYDLEAPYEAGRVRVLIGQACRALNDLDGAEMEFDAAGQVFLHLGAKPDSERVAGLLTESSDPKPHLAGLTEREIEVLRLVAAGGTNHSIAEELVVSDHTVRRHLQNIFAKTGVSSRAGATAYAFRHGLA